MALLRPEERAFESIVTPKELTINGNEAWRAKNAQPLCFLGLCSQLRFDLVRLCRCEHPLAIDLQTRKYIGDGRRVINAATALPELRAIEPLAEILAPGFGQTNQRDPRSQQAVLREWLGSPG